MRDFRDAKTMAHALRNALQDRAVAITHSDSLELIAKAFGYDDWNILAAKIEAMKLRAQEDRPPAGAAKTLYCSFCSKSQHDVRKLIAGPSVFICDECVGICNDIIEEAPIWKVVSLLFDGEKGGTDGYAAALEHARAETTEKIAAYMEQGRHFVEHNRSIVRRIDRLIATPHAAPIDDDPAAAARFAYLNDKTTGELRAMRGDAERTLDRFETALRIGASVLVERASQS
jgi:hypothetical protein